MAVTHSYGSHPRQTVTIHQPEPADPHTSHPGLVMIHGGYWAKDSGLGRWPKHFTEAGFVVIEADYRLNADAPWPAQRDDVMAALGWARTHAGQFRLDPERIALFGSSAGGHLAVMLGMFAASIGSVVALSAPLSPYRAWTDGAEPHGAWAEKKKRLRAEAEKLAGCAPKKGTPCWDLWVDLVCYQHIVGDEPPMWLGFYSDDLVPPAHGVDFRHHRREAGGDRDDVTVHVVQDRGHAMTLMERPGIADAVTGFLARSVADKN